MRRTEKREREKIGERRQRRKSEKESESGKKIFITQKITHTHGRRDE